MKLILKQRIFTWFDSYNILNDKQEIEYKVKGRLAFGHKFEIYDKNDKYLAMVKEEIITILPKYKIYIGEECIGEIKMKLTIFKPKFTLECLNWKIIGDILGWNYKIVKSDKKTIASVKKRLLHLVDYYEIDIPNSKDALHAIMIVLAIDATSCSKNNSISFNTN